MIKWNRLRRGDLRRQRDGVRVRRQRTRRNRPDLAPYRPGRSLATEETLSQENLEEWTKTSKRLNRLPPGSES